MMVVLVRILRFLMLLFLVRLALRLVADWLRPRPAFETKPAADAPRELVRDRICNTFLPRGRALIASVAGRDEHFCSIACRDRALAQASVAS
jgi:hypothetical protein